MKFRANKFVIVFLSLLAGLLIVDIVTKVLTNGIDYTRIIPYMFAFESHHNTGIAFSWLSGARIWLCILTGLLSITVTIAWWFIVIKRKIFAPSCNSERKFMFLNISFAFFIAGAVGNLCDRIFYGYVRDFIMFDFWKSFPIFNFADIFLTAGTIMLAIYFIFFSNAKQGETKEKQIEKGDIKDEKA